MMKSNRKTLTVVFIVSLLLSACGNTSNSETVQSPAVSTQGETDLNSSDKELSNEDLENKLNEEDDIPADTSTDSNEDESLTTSNSGIETAELNKDDYLNKLNEMEKADRYSDVGTTIVELEEQEAERYKKWDVELNAIYGLLKEQLSTEQMDHLREEQRKWIIERDEIAKESSLKYKGGTTETLEYVATQASLTRERCYKLVARYMK